MRKAYALGALAVLSLIVPAIEAGITGHIEPFGKFAVAQTLLSVVPIYWWYHIDKHQRNYRAGPLMNVGVVALAVVALPIYFIRSRGWKRGSIATVAMVGAAVLIGVLGVIGEQVGYAVAP